MCAVPDIENLFQLCPNISGVCGFMENLNLKIPTFVEW